MSKKILRVEFDYDFTLIGISSVARDYRLCWFINKSLPVRFQRVNDHILINDFGEESYFSCFKFSIENTETDLYLLSNKSSTGLLIPESKQTDFLILSTEAISDEDEKLFIHLLNKIEVVQTAYTIDPSGLKSRENLLFF